MTRSDRSRRGWIVLSALFGLLCVTGPGSAMATETEPITLTSGVVKAIDYASGVVLLDSGLKLRVRTLIVNDQIADVATVRIDDMIFVSGIELDPASAAVRTRP
jgi:hypothetical protein